MQEPDATLRLQDAIVMHTASGCQPQHSIPALKPSCLQMQEQDDTARLQAAMAMRLVAGKAPGVHAMLRSNALSALVALLQDKLPAIR